MPCALAHSSSSGWRALPSPSSPGWLLWLQGPSQQASLTLAPEQSGGFLCVPTPPSEHSPLRTPIMAPSCLSCWTGCPSRTRTLPIHLCSSSTLLSARYTRYSRCSIYACFIDELEYLFHWNLQTTILTMSNVYYTTSTSTTTNNDSWYWLNMYHVTMHYDKIFIQFCYNSPSNPPRYPYFSGMTGPREVRQDAQGHTASLAQNPNSKPLLCQVCAHITHLWAILKLFTISCGTYTNISLTFFLKLNHFLQHLVLGNRIWKVTHLMAKFCFLKLSQIQPWSGGSVG